MLELNATFFAIAGPAVAFSAMSKAGFGGGAGFAASAILALYLTPGQALGIMLPMLMLIDVATLRPYWGTWSWRDARVLILGAVPGIALGAAFYTIAAPDLIRAMIGGLALIFVLWQLARRLGLVRVAGQGLPAPAGLAAGLVSGFTSFVSHAGGPPAAIYLLSQGLGKTAYQGTTVLVFWVINIVKFAPYAWLGLFTAQTALANLALAPFALAGVWIGVTAHRRIPETLFFGLTYVLLSLTGAKLIWDALT